MKRLFNSFGERTSKSLEDEWNNVMIMKKKKKMKGVNNLCDIFNK